MVTDFDYLAAAHLDNGFHLPEEPVSGAGRPRYDVQDHSQLRKLRAQLVDSAGLDHIPDPDPLIGTEVLFRDSLNWLVGKPGSAKSFIALDMAGCVAVGQPWQTHRVTPGPVLYLVAEGVRGIKRRVRAWESSMGTRMTGVHFLPVAVQSRDAGQWKALIELAKEILPALIVLDTQARITVGVEENSNADMGVFVDQAERLRAACGACVLIVHHIGRNGDTGRGATTLDGALSTIIKVTKEDALVTLECTKNKDGEQWEPIRLRTIPVLDSLILARGEGAPMKLRDRKWLRDWWNQHETEYVSVSTLVDTGIVSKSMFHRDKLSLLKAGLIEQGGTNSATRYRLSGDPSQVSVPVPVSSSTP